MHADTTRRTAEMARHHTGTVSRSLDACCSKRAEELSVYVARGALGVLVGGEAIRVSESFAIAVDDLPVVAAAVVSRG